MIEYIEQEWRDRHVNYTDYGNRAKVLARRGSGADEVQIWWQLGSTGWAGIGLQTYWCVRLYIAKRSGFGWQTETVVEGRRLSQALLWEMDVDDKISKALNIESFARIYKRGKTAIIK